MSTEWTKDKESDLGRAPQKQAPDRDLGLKDPGRGWGSQMEGKAGG